MDELDALLAAKAAQGGGDPLDALLAARSGATAPKAMPAPQGPPAPIRHLPQLTFAEKYIAPALESVVGSNPQGSAAGRVVQGAADPMIGLTQMAGNAVGLGDPVNKRVASLEQDYQAHRGMAGSKGFDPLRMTGNVVTSFLAPGVTAAPKAGLLANMLRGGATGAAFNMAQPVTDAQPATLSDLVTGREPANYWAEKGKQGLIGGAFGAAAVPAAAGLASIVRPNTAPAARKLMDEGITLTPGQILGGGFHRAEDAATSIPVLGDFVRDAKNRTLEDLQRAGYARALDPVGVDASKFPVGPKGIEMVKNALGDKYDALLQKLSFDAKTIKPELDSLRAMAANLPEKEARQFSQILDKNLGQLSENGIADGKTFKLITSNLGTQAKNFRSATDGYQKQLGDALTEAQSIFRQGLTRSNPEFAQELGKIDEGYSNYVRLRAAGASAGEKSRGFTPAQLAAAVRGSEKSMDKKASGNALMQDLSSAAEQVLPSQVGDSGTPLRHAIQAAIGGLVGHTMLPESMSALMVPAAGAVGGLALPYTKVGQKLAQTVLAERPEYATSLAAVLRRMGPVVGAASAPALTNGFSGVN